jgi:hypothetical protein
MEQLLLRTNEILKEHNVNIENPYANCPIYLIKVRETVIQDYKEEKLTRGEYFRTLFELSKLFKRLQYF